MTKGREASARACRQLPASRLRADHDRCLARAVNHLSARSASPIYGRTLAGSALAGRVGSSSVSICLL